MADAAHVVGDIPDRPAGDWRKDISAIAHALREQYLRHPWLPTVVVTIGLHTIRVANLVASVALGHRRDAATAQAITLTIHHFVRGAAVGEIAESRRPSKEPGTKTPPGNSPTTGRPC
jgi:hypothetical protein